MLSFSRCAGVFLACSLLACTRTKPTNSLPEADLSAVKWEPNFPEDINTLQAQEGVEPVEAHLVESAVVSPDTLRFPVATSPEVGNWAPGRIVVSPPSSSSGEGKNPFGFARRVVSIAREGDTFVVQTEAVKLEDIVSGELRMRVDSSDLLQDVDLSQVDLQWASRNLYDTSTDNVFYPTLEAMSDDSVLLAPAAPTRGSPNLRPQFLGGVLKTVGGVAEKVGEKVTETTESVATTTFNVLTQAVSANFTGAGDFTSTVTGEANDVVFVKDVEYVKTKRSAKGRDLDIALKINRLGLKKASFKLNPGIQFSVNVPNKLSPNASPLGVKLDVAAKSELDMVFDYDISASVRTRPGAPAIELRGSDQQPLSEFGEEEQGDIYDAVNAALFGDPDFKLPQGFRKLLYITKPKILYVQAGPAPVVVTFTVQFDLQCGLSAKGVLQGTLGFKHAGSFAFSGSYTEGSSETMSPPQFSQATNSIENTMKGGGELIVSCGIVPRVNSLVYDTVGVGVGIRSSIGTKITPKAICPGQSPNVELPKNQLDFDFTAELAAQITGRAQLPGASVAGKEGAKLGVELGPIEPFFRSFPIGKTSLTVGSKFGYCPGTSAASGGTASGVATTHSNGKKVTSRCGVASVLCELGAACSTNSDCARPGACIAGVCSSDTCNSGFQDGLETGVDCGGTCPNKCAVGGGCRLDTDCAAGTCGLQSFVCVADHCIDGKYNADEAGIDCGGSCPKKCKNGVYCFDATGQSCESGYVFDYRCVAGTCFNGTQDNGESAIDCGGTSLCSRCGPSASCTSNADCQAGIACSSRNGASVCTAPTCNAVKGQPASCVDNVQNCAETDIDCGGSACAKCDTARKCLAPRDCQSGVCNNGTCAASTCNDGVKNGAEADVDCGSGCERCAAGRTCSAGTDCASNSCSNGTCAAPTCTDTAKNGNETDIDCGGADCPKCALTKSCLSPSDCALNYCIAGTCRDSSCSDLLQNGRETAVDCGGPDCSRCGNGLTCNANTDCQSLVCATTCQTPTCSDLTKNGTETDVDCGGAGCGTCANGRTCNIAADCNSGVCNLGVCVSALCNDLVKNGNETDVDCGGPDCNKCIDGKTCLVNSDCNDYRYCTTGSPTASSSSGARMCMNPASCSDGIANHSETGLDCGGEVCAKIGRICNAGNTTVELNPSTTGLRGVGTGDFVIGFTIDTATNSKAIAEQRAACNYSAPAWTLYINDTGRVVLDMSAGQTSHEVVTSSVAVNDDFSHQVRITRVANVFYMSVDNQVAATWESSGVSIQNFVCSLPEVTNWSSVCAAYTPFTIGVDGTIGGPTFGLAVSPSCP